MNFQVKLIKNEQRRAVAPIIATLLMVAISVVGGILIFVFSQGFFKDTSIQSPTIDAIEIWGYNAKDIDDVGFRLHNNESVTCGAGVLNSQKIDDDACLALFIRNSGSSIVVLETVRLYGIDVPFEITAGTIGSDSPDAGEWCLVQIVSIGCSGDRLLQPGQEMTLIIKNDKDTLNGEIKIGRPILWALETGQGQTFTKQIRAGLSSGID